MRDHLGKGDYAGRAINDLELARAAVEQRTASKDLIEKVAVVLEIERALKDSIVAIVGGCRRQQILPCEVVKALGLRAFHVTSLSCGERVDR